ncbi:MAG: DnaB-like helicase C-terminal domain-containing protein [Candidatus Bilamarchaeaceae archaeon]
MAITGNELWQAGINIHPEFFGNESVDPLAFIAGIVAELTKHGEVPGFELVRAKIRSSPMLGAQFTVDDVLAELAAIEATDVTARETIANDFSKFCTAKKAILAVQEAYADLIRKSEVGAHVDVDDVISSIAKKTSDVRRNFRGWITEEAPEISVANTDGILFGLDELDNKTSGIRRGEVFMLLGPPKGRKTSFLLSMCIRSLLRNPDIRAAFISYEMTLESMYLRAKTSLQTIALSHNLPADDSVSLAELSSALALGHRLWMGQLDPGATAVDAKRIIDLLHSSGFVPDLIVLDYVAFMYPTVKYTEKRHQLAQIGRDLTKLAKQTNTAILTAHLLRRESMEKESHISRTDIAECYEMIAIVDAALAIESPPDMKERRQYELRIVAARRFEDDVSAGVYEIAYDGITVCNPVSHQAQEERIIAPPPKAPVHAPSDASFDSWPENVFDDEY